MREMTMEKIMDREGASYWILMAVSIMFLVMGIVQQSQGLSFFYVIARLELLFFLGITGLGYVCDSDTGCFVILAAINLNAAIAMLVSIWSTPDNATKNCICIGLIIALVLEIVYDDFKKIRRAS